MRIERRFTVNDKRETVLHGIVLICETQLESQIIDQCCGDRVDEDGLINTVQAEVRLSDGYGDHYLYIPCIKNTHN